MVNGLSVLVQTASYTGVYKLYFFSSFTESLSKVEKNYIGSPLCSRRVILEHIARIVS